MKIATDSDFQIKYIYFHVKSNHVWLQNNFWLICTLNCHVINNTWRPSRWWVWPNRLPRIGSDSISASSCPIKLDVLWCTLQCVVCSGNWQLEGEIEIQRMGTPDVFTATLWTALGLLSANLISSDTDWLHWVLLTTKMAAEYKCRIVLDCEAY